MAYEASSTKVAKIEESVLSANSQHCCILWIMLTNKIKNVNQNQPKSPRSQHGSTPKLSGSGNHLQWLLQSEDYICKAWMKIFVFESAFPTQVLT